MKSGLDELEGGFRSTASQAGVLGAALSGMGLAGVAAGAALVGIGAAAGKARQAFDYADEIADTAAKLAVTTDALQEYRYAIELLGGQTADADSALEGFAKTLGLAQSGLSKKAIKPFQALGLDPTTFSSAEEGLEAVIEKLSALGSTAQQAALADKLGIGSIIPAIRAGGDAIADLRKEARETGQVMDASLIQKGGEANDELLKLSGTLRTEINSALIQLAPSLTAVAGGVKDIATELRPVIELFAKLKQFDDWSKERDWSKHWGSPVVAQVIGQRTGLANFGPWAARALGLNRKPADAAATAAPAAPPVPKPDGTLVDIPDAGAADKAAKRAAASEAAIEQATAAELSARLALARGVERVAALKLQQVDAETKAANRRLSEDAAAGDISRASAQIATDLNNKAAAAKKELIEREKIDALAEMEFSARQSILRDLDRLTTLQAEAANTLEARDKAERQIMAQQHRLEQDQLAHRGSQIDALDAEAQNAHAAAVAAQADRQAAEKAAQAQEHRARVLQQSVDLADAELEGQAAILGHQADLARSAYEYTVISQKLAEIERERLRLAAQAVIDDEKATPAAKKRAKLQLDYVAYLQKHNNEERQRREALLQDFQNASGGVRNMIDAFDNLDFATMANEFKNLVDGLESTSGKIAAVAGIVDGIGRAIGGTTGSTMSGAASGAMAGLTLSGGNPIGAAVGAIVGGIGGFLSGNKAKKQAKAEAAKKLADDRLQLDIALLEAQGRSLEALALSRKRELDAMDASLRGLQQQIWNEQDSLRIQQEGAALALQIADMDDAILGTNTALVARRAEELKAIDPLNRHLQEIIWARQDEAAALEKAREIAETKQGLENQIMEASGDAVGALTAKRALELAEIAKVDASLVPLLQRLFDVQDAAKATAEAEARLAAQREAADQAVAAARDALSAAYDREADALKGVIDKFKAFASSLASFRQQLTQQGIASASPAAQYAQAKADFERVSALAAKGDEEALGDLQSVSEQFLTVSKEFAPDALTYLRDLSAVKASVVAAEAYANQQVDAASKELELLQKQVDTLLLINESVLSVADAIAGLKSALGRQAEAATVSKAQSTINDLTKGGKFEGYTREQLYSWQNLPAESRSPWALPAPMLAAWNTLQALKDAGINVPGFAKGGVFTNGVVSQPTLFNTAVMGEGGMPEAIMPLARGPDGLGVRVMGSANDNALATEVARLGGDVGRLVKLADDTLILLKKTSLNSTSFRTTAVVGG